MDLLTELENMAANALDKLDTDSNCDDQSIQRWQQLFHYTQAEAIMRIKDHRGNFSRAKISDEHWEIVHLQKEAAGYDRESYEHSLNLATARKPFLTETSDTRKPSTYILKLEGPLSTALEVQKAAGLRTSPTIISGTGDAGEEAKFCRVDGVAKKAIHEFLSKTTFRAMFVLISKAVKTLSDMSIHPTLGTDSTLSQHRLSDADTPQALLPAQDQYPVWYFFYGSLADPEVLARLLSLSEEPVLRPASVAGGVLRTWAGKRTESSLVNMKKPCNTTKRISMKWSDVLLR
ncbi:hypothetical protein GJ744_000743 [Endocarpon pusillum]|uniref:Gamma-glutamylcyclotransferase AIG2-like domain-containing protein n=1 Tax=Endocarpon pusillum TaxID=364733 RepID=A0A8H7E3R0_9EURO|nr:hypothetical protein GJ744_000743 [Endocarpon pusillum]